MVNWVNPSVTIHYAGEITAMSVEAINRSKMRFWSMPVKSPEDALSVQQQERAKEARELHNQLGDTHIEDNIHMDIIPIPQSVVIILSYFRG